MTRRKLIMSRRKLSGYRRNIRIRLVCRHPGCWTI